MLFTRDEAVVLVGHGAPPSDAPRDLVTRLKALEGRRAGTHAPPSAEESTLDEELRRWPRTAENDPYHAGITALARALAPRVAPAHLVVAFNEFCAPSLEEVVDKLAEVDVRRVRVVPTMLTPGGVHAEREIPAALEALRARHPGMDLRYAWPIDLDALAGFLAGLAARA